MIKLDKQKKVKPKAISAKASDEGGRLVRRLMIS